MTSPFYVPELDAMRVSEQLLQIHSTKGPYFSKLKVLKKPSFLAPNSEKTVIFDTLNSENALFYAPKRKKTVIFRAKTVKTVIPGAISRI